jgi:hypothetical protein
VAVQIVLNLEIFIMLLINVNYVNPVGYVFKKKKVLDRINRMNRMVVCRQEAGKQ